MPDNSLVAIIPARSGSKRLPNKNRKMLAGKPLIQWSIEAALASDSIDKVIVSTDSPEIAEIAVSCGADVPYLRPQALSSDTATCADVVENVLTHLFDEGEEYKYVALLQPTSPLRTSDDIDKAFQLLNKSDALGVVSVCPCEHPPLWSNTLPENNDMSDFIKPLLDFRKSGNKLAQSYRLNGALCITQAKKFLEEKNFYFYDGLVAYKMSRERSVDIDHDIDIKLAECVIKEAEAP